MCALANLSSIKAAVAMALADQRAVHAKRDLQAASERNARKPAKNKPAVVLTRGCGFGFPLIFDRLSLRDRSRRMRASLSIRASFASASNPLRSKRCIDGRCDRSDALTPLQVNSRRSSLSAKASTCFAAKQAKAYPHVYVASARRQTANRRRDRRARARAQFSIDRCAETTRLLLQFLEANR